MELEGDTEPLGLTDGDTELDGEVDELGETLLLGLTDGLTDDDGD